MNILTYCTALPAYRLESAEIKTAWGTAPRGLISKPVCGFDEDPITLGIEAATAVSNQTGAQPAALFLGATSLPYEEKPASADLAAAIGLGTGALVSEIRGSAQAGLQALYLAGLHAQSSGQPTLAILTDAPEGPEHTGLGQACGAGAVAFLLGPDTGCARLGAPLSASHPAFGHRFRRRGARALSDLELRSDPTGEALAALDLPQVQHLAGGLPARLEKTLAKRCGAQGDGLAPLLGDAGTANAGLALAHILDTARAGAQVLALATGGGAMALPLTVTADGPGTQDLPARLKAGARLRYIDYLKHRRTFTGGQTP